MDIMNKYSVEQCHRKINKNKCTVYVFLFYFILNLSLKISGKKLKNSDIMMIFQMLRKYNPKI